MSASVITVVTDKEQTFIFDKPDVQAILSQLGKSSLKHVLINVDSRYRFTDRIAKNKATSSSSYHLTMPFGIHRVHAMHLVSLETRYYMINIPEQVALTVTYTAPGGTSVVDVLNVWPGNWSPNDLVGHINSVLNANEIKLVVDERSSEWAWTRPASAEAGSSVQIDAGTLGSYLKIDGGLVTVTSPKVRAGLPLPSFFPTHRYTFLRIKNCDHHRSTDESVQFFAKVVWPAAIPSTCLNNFIAAPVVFDPPRPVGDLEVQFVDYLGKEAPMDEHSFTLLVVYE